MNESMVDRACYLFLLLGLLLFVLPVVFQLLNKLSEEPSVRNLEEVLTLFIYLMIPWPLTLENSIKGVGIFLLLIYGYCNKKTGLNL